MANQFQWALFDSSLAALTGADSVSWLSGARQADGGYDSLIQHALAYSALDEGVRPFGDAGIRALYDDLNDLGRIAAATNHDAFLDQLDFDVRTVFYAVPNQLITSVVGFLAHIVTEYAAALAVYGVHKEGVPFFDVIGAPITDGIVQVAQDGNTFAIDLSSVYWFDVLKLGANGDPAKVIEIKDEAVFLANYFEQSAETDADLRSLLPGGQLDEQGLADLADLGWAADDYAIFDRIHLRAVAGVTEFALEDRAYATSTDILLMWIDPRIRLEGRS